ncbi:MAG: hypothetical protein QOG46_2679 [Pseudonocardiales bacterium]|jgi:hypothetical protein|nr:hypothetical protein [Pseudonocardiales bacterium]
MIMESLSRPRTSRPCSFALWLGPLVTFYGLIPLVTCMLIWARVPQRRVASIGGRRRSGPRRAEPLKHRGHGGIRPRYTEVGP